jgi:hypothetical protein
MQTIRVRIALLSPWYGEIIEQLRRRQRELPASEQTRPE